MGNTGEEAGALRAMAARRAPTHAALPAPYRRGSRRRRANLSLEPENRVAIVRAGAVPALIGVLASGAASAPVACEHAAGALFGLALHEGNHAAIGVLGAMPPLLALLTTRDRGPCARRDAGMALYHLSLAAVNQSKLPRAPGAAKNLLSRPLIVISERAHAGIQKEMARKALLAMLGLGDNSDGNHPDFSNSEGNGRSITTSDPVHRRCTASWGAPPAASPQNPHLWRSVCID